MIMVTVAIQKEPFVTNWVNIQQTQPQHNAEIQMTIIWAPRNKCVLVFRKFELVNHLGGGA